MGFKGKKIFIEAPFYILWILIIAANLHFLGIRFNAINFDKIELKPGKLKLPTRVELRLDAPEKIMIDKAHLCNNSRRWKIE